MLDDRGFDLWADGYDRQVGISDAENSYPFAGYREILGRIYRVVMEKPGASVLDIGFGTGTLAVKLYENGCRIYGQDFSARMIELASEKMPGALLLRGDFSKGLAEPLLRRKYDFVVATYSLHHLNHERKVSLLRLLRGLLKEQGRILIGDVAFENRSRLEACRREAGEEWDDDEIYFVADELKRQLPGLQFIQISCCGGILVLQA